ncbi:hypothetical protein [Changpingibacter yushuensis]|uniref:hypothetical protein n=1 Tax=Changpingibacter yushuensis TaxID=2758440 RepID=UPI001CB7104D|nr:hypothetical protein [Changpingibacter yushuensis]
MADRPGVAQIAAQRVRPAHQRVEVLQPPLNGIAKFGCLHHLPADARPQSTLGLQPRVDAVPAVKLIDERDRRDAQVGQPLPHRLGRGAESDEALHGFLHRESACVLGCLT